MLVPAFSVITDWQKMRFSFDLLMVVVLCVFITLIDGEYFMIFLSGDPLFFCYFRQFSGKRKWVTF